MEPKVKPEYEFEKAKVKQALICLRELLKKNSENAGKLKLFDETKDEPVVLQFTMKKIPKLPSFQRIRVRLPYSYLKEDADVCLITGDLDKRDRKADIEGTVLYYKDMLKNLDINNVTEVVPLRQLRTEYQSFESLRQLSGQYDVFLSDNKVHQCLPKLLGSTFIKCRKFPIQIYFGKKNLKNQVDQALSGTVFYVTGRGSMCASKVAHLGLKDIQIIKNVRTTVETLAARVPGGWKNISGIYLRTSCSVSIPIYVSFEIQEDIQFEIQQPKEIDFLSSVNEYIREQEEDSFTDSDEETETKEIEKKGIKVANGKRLKVENNESPCELKVEGIQNKVPKAKKRKIFPSLNEYIKKLKEDFLSDDEEERKKRNVDDDSDEDDEENELGRKKKIKGKKTKTKTIGKKIEKVENVDDEVNDESADEVQEKSHISSEKKIKGKKTKKIERKREKVENGVAVMNKESAGEVQEKSELSTEKKIKGKKAKTKKVEKKIENYEGDANEESAGEVQKKIEVESTGNKIKGKKTKEKKIEKRVRVENDDDEESAHDVLEKIELRSTDNKIKGTGKVTKKMAKANVEQAKKINKNKNEKSLVMKQKKKVKISVT